MDMVVHRDIYLLYMIEVSYYIHGLYTLFVHDVWRKDSPVMATHHIICILLLWLSYVQRCVVPWSFSNFGGTTLWQ